MTTTYTGIPGNTSAHDLPVQITVPVDTEVNTVASIRLSIDYLTDRVAFLMQSALLLDQAAELVTGTVEWDTSAELNMLAGSVFTLQATASAEFNTSIDTGANFQFNHLATNSDVLFDPTTGAWFSQSGFLADQTSFPNPEDSGYAYSGARTVAGKIISACEFQCEQNNGVSADGIFVADSTTDEIAYWEADPTTAYKVQASFRLPLGASANDAMFLLENTSGGAINVSVRIFLITRDATPTPGAPWTRNTIFNSTVSVGANSVEWKNPAIATVALTDDQTIVLEVILPSGGDIKFFGARYAYSYLNLNPEI